MQSFKEGIFTVTKICEWHDVSRAIYYKYLKRGPDGRLRPHKQD